MKICVKKETGNLIILDVGLYDSILMLKKKIEYKENIYVEQQQIIFKDQQLHNNLSLIDYNIKEESILSLNIKLNKIEIDIPEYIVYCREKSNFEDKYYEYFKIEKSAYTHKVLYSTKSDKVSINDKLNEIKKKFKCIQEEERKKFDDFFLDQLRCN